MELSQGHLDFFHSRTLPSILHVLVSRTSGLACYLPAVCADSQLLGCKFPETETGHSSSQQLWGKGAWDASMNVCSQTSEGRLSCGPLLLLKEGAPIEILDKEHIRDFFNRKHLT